MRRRSQSSHGSDGGTITMIAHHAGVLNRRQETMLGISVIIVATITLMVAVGVPSVAGSGV